LHIPELSISVFHGAPQRVPYPSDALPPKGAESQSTEKFKAFHRELLIHPPTLPGNGKMNIWRGKKKRRLRYFYPFEKQSKSHKITKWWMNCPRSLKKLMKALRLRMPSQNGIVHKYVTFTEPPQATVMNSVILEH
jgi:hypothetical protein